MVWRSSIQALGYAPANGKWVVAYPLVTVVVLAGIQWALAKLQHIDFAYFSPFVAAAAAVSSRICLRSGLLVAVLSAVVFLLLLPRPHDDMLPNLAESVAILSALAVVFLTAPRLSDDPPADAGKLSGKDPLPFMRPRKPGKSDDAGREANCWAVQASGDWGDDDWYGSQMAKIWRHRLSTRVGDCPPLSMIIRDMVRAGRWTGVEAGFCASVESSIRERAAPAMHVMNLSKHNPDDLRVH